MDEQQRFEMIGKSLRVKAFRHTEMGEAILEQWSFIADDLKRLDRDERLYILAAIAKYTTSVLTDELLKGD